MAPHGSDPAPISRVSSSPNVLDAAKELAAKYGGPRGVEKASKADPSILDVLSLPKSSGIPSDYMVSLSRNSRWKMKWWSAPSLYCASFNLSPRLPLMGFRTGCISFSMLVASVSCSYRTTNLNTRAESSRHCDPNHPRSSFSRSVEAHVEGSAPHHHQGELRHIIRFLLLF